MNDADISAFPALKGDKIVTKINERGDDDYEAISIAGAIAIALRDHVGGDVYTLIVEILSAQ